MAHAGGRLRLILLCAALLPAGFGCGISTYQVRFVPDTEELKGKPSIPVYVYFAPSHDVELCLKLASRELFERSGQYEKRLNPQLMQSTVVSAEGPVQVTGEGLPAPLAKVFIWGNFAAKVEEGGNRLVVEPDRFQSSFLSGEGVLEVPVHPTGFGSPK